MSDVLRFLLILNAIGGFVWSVWVTRKLKLLLFERSFQREFEPLTRAEKEKLH